MACTPRVRPTTWTGTRLSVVELFPSWSRLFAPQHWTPPSTTAQLCEAPATTDCAPLARPTTWTGTWLLMFAELFPSWPFPFSPQHSTPPFTTAQAWLLPTAIACTPLVRPETGTGTWL